MKLIALPLSKSSPAKNIFFHCHLPSNSPFAPAPFPAGSLQHNLYSRLEKVGTSAVKYWDSLSTQPESSIRGRIYSTGNSILDRISSEEWFLKEVPKLNNPRQLVDKFGKVSLCHPRRLDQSLIQSQLHQLISKRLKIHQRGLYLSVAALPASIAFSIVPGPNLPLFYNIFRLHAHYTAFHAAKSISWLIENNAISYEQDDVLEHCFITNVNEGLPEEDIYVNDIVPESLILRIAKAAENYGGGPGLHQELDRAVRQLHSMK
ncbi:hypothetical protein HK098_002105 [Nowakowskiella sp. JEL0407]|nr:hypothetical protein HK098_002105 [Nowakowskiella sp. JEL0407]